MVGGEGLSSSPSALSSLVLSFGAWGLFDLALLDDWLGEGLSSSPSDIQKEKKS